METSMFDIKVPALLATAVAMFLIGAVWNSIFGSILLEARGGDSASMPAALPVSHMLAEAVRVLVVAAVAAIVFQLAGVTDVWAALKFGLLIWFGFQAALLSGAIIWEGMTLRVYAIHAGDALLKMVSTCAILGLWR
jgi:Protein of unknown function (DUF1761)